MKPFFSIIIPLYNKVDVVETTIDSALKQTFSDFEIIVVNDGSTDSSLVIVENIRDPRIKIFTTKNQGVSATRNFGIKQAQADYIAFLDADDIWYSNHLHTLSKLLKQYPNCGLYCTAYAKQIKSLITPAVYRNIPKIKGWTGLVTNYFESSIKNSVAWTSAVMVPKDILNTFGGFNETITLGAGEDTDLWIRIVLKHPVAFCNTITAIHNLQAENRLSNANTDLRNFIDLDVYEPLAKENLGLKKYLDGNRFAIGMQYKLVGNTEKAQSYFSKINPTSLNKKQRFLSQRSKGSLLFLKSIQDILRKLKINLTPFH